MGCKRVDWIHLAQDRVQWQEPSDFMKGRLFRDQQSDC
jgi:hypothetical protein